MEPESKCFTNTRIPNIQTNFTLNCFEEEWIFAMVVNLVHESMFANFWLMMLQDQDVL